MDYVPVVTKHFGHELVEQRCGRQPGEVAVAAVVGEPVAGERRHDDVEAVPRIRAVPGGIGERADQPQVLDERTGPAVRQQQR